MRAAHYRTMQRILQVSGIVLFGVLAVGNGLDRISQQNLAIERLVPEPFRSQAHRSAATLAVTRQLPDEALTHALEAVHADPIHPDSTSLLGVAYLMAEDYDNADSAFRIAARFGWRNLPTQLYWYDAALAAGDPAVAMDRADAILRVAPSFPQFNEILAPLEEDPVGRKNLQDHLALRPDWRTRYIDNGIGMDPEALGRRASMLTLVGESGSPLGCAGLVRFTRTLLQTGERQTAERMWNANCPEQRVGSNITDPGFEMIGSAIANPFAWQVRRDGDLLVSSREGDGGDHYVVLRSAARATMPVLQQSLALEPGTYRVAADVEAANSTAASRLVVTVGCDEGAPFPSASAAGIAAGGTTLEIGRCGRQAFTIWLRPGEGEVRLDDISIVPLD